MTEQRFSELLPDYLGGELDPAQSAEFELALRANPQWHARAAGLSAAHAALAALTTDSLLDQSDRPARPRRFASSRRWLKTLSYAALLLVAFGVGVRVGLTRTAPPPKPADEPPHSASLDFTPRLAGSYVRVANRYPDASTFTRALLTIANR